MANKHSSLDSSLLNHSVAIATTINDTTITTPVQIVDAVLSPLISADELIRCMVESICNKQMTTGNTEQEALDALCLSNAAAAKIITDILKF